MTIKMTHSLRGLEWLVEELDTSLGLAREALLAYRTDSDDPSQLSFAHGYLHQVKGSLTMAQCYGGVLLAQEMEAALNILLEASPGNVLETCAVLEQSMVALPAYIRDLLSGRDDTLAQLIQQINELRAIRSAPLISSCALFMPSMVMFDPRAEAVSASLQSLARVDKETLGKLQKVYQYALLAYLKQREAEKNQQKIAAVLQRLQSTFKNSPLEILWRVAVFFLALYWLKILHKVPQPAICSGSSIKPCDS